MSQRYLLALGSNELAEQRMVEMIEALLAEFGPLWLSPICRTKAIGCAVQDYLNCVVSFESLCLFADVKSSCKQIEADLGRVRSSPWCAADIDILCCWGDVVRTHARQIVQEPYLWSMVDSLLVAMDFSDGDLQDGSHDRCRKMVTLTLSSGHHIGEHALYLLPGDRSQSQLL